MLAKLPFGLGDWLGAKIQRLYFGDLSRYGLTQSRQYPIEQLRETGKTPVIDIGTVKAIKQGKIVVVPEVVRFTHAGVIPGDGKEIKCEHVLLATGYRTGLESLVNDVDTFLDMHGYPKSAIGAGDLEGLYFVGFDNYRVGGILGTIYTDSDTVVQKLIQSHSATR
jgi:hypothetical protein